eukprot:TRINITY_DN3621_c0_g4_i1.p1 TRINITY_DN3621_c0_g4~~TRINITY_DN3621_c0_g4_i1.p1  ORF type:complete len:298 (+),score=64.46 TRINITY_DN3621_c0_g4_i1:128-1021(+)
MKSASPEDDSNIRLNSFEETSSIPSDTQSHNAPTEVPSRQKEERILSLTIDIPQGGQEVLEIKDTDNIAAIAAQFCAKYNLDEECKDVLLESIKEHLFGCEQMQKENAFPLEGDKTISVANVSSGKESPGPKNEESTTKKEKKQSADPNKMKQLTNELELWKKEVELKIKQGNVFNQPAINQHSKQIVGKKGQAKVPVHERLHQNARDKQVSLKKTKENDANLTTRKRPKTRDQKKAAELNAIPFQLLYYKGLRQMKKMEKNTEQAIQEKMQRELESAPFRPKINANSRRMVNCLKM